MTFGQNSVMSKFGAGVVESQKSLNLFLFMSIDRESELYYIFKNQTPRSRRRGDMGGFLLFFLVNKTYKIGVETSIHFFFIENVIFSKLCSRFPRK